MNPSASYFRTNRLGGATPRETEILAFGLCNDRLTKAATPRARVEALNKTHQLWSILARDLEMPANGLPQDLKQQLVALAFWAMAYSTQAITRDLAVQPLVDVHAAMIEGLRAQQHAASSAGTVSVIPRATSA